MPNSICVRDFVHYSLRCFITVILTYSTFHTKQQYLQYSTVPLPLPHRSPSVVCSRVAMPHATKVAEISCTRKAIV